MASDRDVRCRRKLAEQHEAIIDIAAMALAAANLTVVLDRVPERDHAEVYRRTHLLLERMANLSA